MGDIGVIPQFAFFGREQLREFAVVRRQDDGLTAAFHRLGKPHRLAGKTRQRIGIEDDGARGPRPFCAALQGSENHGAGLGADAQCRAP